jgi:hypothetical protein
MENLRKRDNLRKEAKRWLNALRANDPDARARLTRAYPKAPALPVLRDVQHALACEHGYDNWAAMTHALERPAPTSAPPLTREGYERLAQDYVQAFDAQDATALQRMNAHYNRTFTFDDLFSEIWRRVYAFRQRSSKVPKHFLKVDEAQMLVAQNAGFGSWDSLIASLETGASPIPPYSIDTQRNAIAPRRMISDREWDQLIALMKERRIEGLEASGLMTDALIARIADLDHVIALGFGGSRGLSDDGLLQLARMPQLRCLNLSEYPGGKLTDRGLEVLRHLPNLRQFEMTWQKGITDVGVANLRFCDQIERVDLMGSPTGDGAIEALQGKPNLSSFASGKLVTDAGLRLLQNFPRLKTWQGDENTRLLIDGPFTNAGLANLTGLDGVFDLDLFWHVTGITSDGFAHLAGLPNLGSLGVDGKLSDDEAMRHFGALPRLRKLRAQGTVARDEGFEALSRSQTLEQLWTRETPHLGSSGFIALSRMPSLHTLGVSCKQVSDEALATLPDFPSLRELTPIDVTDTGFRHIGHCAKLERLSCMYCRETTDIATEHIGGLQLRSYYAGLTQITDRSLEILGRMGSLERIELYECLHVTDAGLVFLATLPRLRQFEVSGSPGVTIAGTRVFPSSVTVRYSM